MVKNILHATSMMKRKTHQWSAAGASDAAEERRDVGFSLKEERAVRVIFDRFAAGEGPTRNLSLAAFEKCLQALNFRLKPGEARKLFIKLDKEAGGQGSLGFRAFVEYVFHGRED